MSTLNEIIAIAIQHHQAGQWDEALLAYREVLAISPDYAEVHYNVATILQLQGQLDAAIDAYQRVIGLNPNFAQAHNNLGNILKDRGQIEGSIRAYQRAIDIQPGYAEAYNNLAGAFQALKQHAAAIQFYQLAIEFRPDLVQAYLNLGLCHVEQSHYTEAANALQQAIRLDPANADALNCLGNVLQRMGHLEASIDAYLKVLRIDPNYAVAYNNLATAYKEQAKFVLAEAAYLRAIELKADYPDAYSNLASIYLSQGQPDLAIQYYRKAVELKPDFDQAAAILANQMQRVCDWSGLDALSRRLMDTVDRDCQDHGISPFAFLALPSVTTNEQQLKCARNWSRAVALTPATLRRNASRFVAKTDDTRLKIGYISGDFHGHATAWLIAEMIEQHCRERFQIFAYSYGPDETSDTRRRIRRAFDYFRDIRELSYPDSAAMIMADEIDILIDLKGYTTLSRAEILAYRPAPIQVNYLGYPGTMGADFIDYILVDDFVVPTSEQRFYTEHLVYLPGCYQPNDSQQTIAKETPSRAECGLPESGFVFCSFNSSYKLTPALFTIWMRLLRAIPGSVLWLLEANALATSNLRRQAELQGVDPSRLVFASILALPEHLARHRLADLFLDSFPVNAHTTASDALRMRLPIVTLSGETFASRVAGSLLHALGMPELITRNFDDYESLALRLATNPNELSNLRLKLDAHLQSSRLYDGRFAARRVEKAYSDMWTLYQTQQPPRPIEISSKAQEC